MKKWIKLLRAIGKHKKDDVIEVDESTARAYIEAEAAIEHEQAAHELDATVQGEVDALRRAFTDGIAAIRTEVETALRVVPGRSPVASTAVDAGDSEDDKAIRGGGIFRDLGHFAKAIQATGQAGMVDPTYGPQVARYTQAVTNVTRAANERAIANGAVSRAVTGMSEGVDPDGGLLIPAEYSTAIWERARNQNEILERVNTIYISGNTYSMNADAETSRADGSRRGGVQGYWQGEADQYTGTRPKFNRRDFRLKKLTVLTYVTEEQLEDTSALSPYLEKVAAEEIGFKVGNAIFNGYGTGDTQGILNAPALVSITKETGQAAATLDYSNITKMWMRFYAPCRKNAVWYTNQDVEAELDNLALPVGTGGLPAYFPPGGLADAPYGRLKGRPVIPVEFCATLGTVGDVILFDPTQYTLVTKSTGVQSSMSIHLRFDYGEVAFKWYFRADGHLMWSSALTPFKGTNTQSCVVGIATRS